MPRGAAGRLWRTMGVAGVAAVLALQGLAVARQSVTSDESFHLLAGTQADRYGRNGLNLEHPPLVKMIAALPLATTAAVPRLVAPEAHEPPLAAIYAEPAAEARARLGGRTLAAAVFGIPFLAVAFLLGREVGGGAAGLCLALALGLSFCVFPYLPLVYMDTAAALGVGLTLWTAGRLLRRPDLASALALGLALGLALASKFTGLLALPVAAAALLLTPAPGRRAWPEAWRRLLGAAVVALAAWGLVEITYAAANRRYDSAFGRETIRRYCENRASMIVGDRLRSWEPYLLALERHDPRAAQWLTGLAATRAQNAIGTYPACNFGTTHSRGRWWYYPVLLLARTPIVLLAATAAALATALAARRRRKERVGDRGEGTAGAAEGQGPVSGAATAADAPAAAFDAVVRRRFVALLASTAGIFLLVAVTSNYNAGLRHLLPVLPILYLPAALWLARRPRVAAVAFAALLVESLALAPTWISPTNTWWLGRRDPMRFALSTDNCYYHQNLIALGEAAERRALRPLFVLDPALGAPQLDRYLGPGVALPPERSPLPAGWYAVGAAAEVCVPAILRSSPDEMYGYPRYRAIALRWLPATVTVTVAGAGEDHGYVAHTFHLYRLARPALPDPAAPLPRAPGGGSSPAAAAPVPARHGPGG
jgi:Dolichyl-phosphate-mannose-protein mannosyltransferase